MVRRLVTGAVSLCLSAVLTSVACAAATAIPDKASSIAASRTTLPFQSLGTGTMELRGISTAGYAQFSVRGDQVITAARLWLRFTYSPAMLPELSHLRISLNEQVITALPLPREQAGREVEQAIDLDPRYFTDYNQLRFELIGHYTLQCEDPQHSSLWLSISPQSRLEVSTRPLELRNELALLPAPFFDRRDNQRLVLPMWLPSQPSVSLVHSAGVAASWFGMLADYRGARFPVSAQVPDRHALVLATNQLQPAGLKLPMVNEPAIRIIDNPKNGQLKLLVLQGRDEAQLADAVSALVHGNPVFSGDTVTVKGVNTSPRLAYDAPRWLRSDRPVKLGELVDSTSQLQVQGIAPPPISIQLRMPPDLFTWNRSGVPMELRYRYTAPTDSDNSLLSITVNQQLLRSFRLKADEAADSGGKLRVPLLNNADAQQRDDLLIPAFQLTSMNLLQFQFALEYHHDGLCREVFTNPTHEAIDPDSVIDISGFYHYVALPNLALFANAGFPFTRHADLSQTGIVLPNIEPATLEQLFFVLGRLGRHTGIAASRYQLLDTQQALKAKNLDLIVLSGAASATLLKTWQHDLSLHLQGSERQFRQDGSAPQFAVDPLRLLRDATPDTRVDVSTNGSLAALHGFESPLTSGRSVVAFTASDSAAAQSLQAVLDDDGKVAQVRGDLAIVKAGVVQSYLGDAVYYSGSLPWWLWLWFHLSRHPVLLTLLAVGMAVLVALLAYGWLQQRLRRRLANAMSNQNAH